MDLPPTAEEAEIRSRLSLCAGTSNKILPKNEEWIVRSLLADEQRCLSELDQEIARFDAIIAGLHRRRQDHISQVNKYSVALSPHKRLPSEILAKIFLHSTTNDRAALPPNYTRAPWVFLQVCSRWREVARAEHCLWSHLEVRGESSLVKNMLTRFLPLLWSPTHTLPVSITLGISRGDISLFTILSPYFHRLSTITLQAGLEVISAFLFGPSATFGILEALDITITGDSTPGYAPPAALATCPRLRRIHIVDTEPMGRFPNRSLLSTIPWSQLVHVTLFIYGLSLAEFERISTHCNNLCSLELTVDALSPRIFGSANADPCMIQLPGLESITLITAGYSSSFDFLDLLYTPSLKELAVDYRYFARPASRECWVHGHLGRMLSRSGCNLETLVLKGGPQDVPFEVLVLDLPSLVKLVVSASTPIPGVIFDMMIRGEALKRLEHLECFTSPIPFLRLLEHQYKHLTSGEYRGLLFARVSYRTLETPEAIDEYEGMYAGLKHSLENGEKEIMLDAIDFSST